MNDNERHNDLFLLILQAVMVLKDIPYRDGV